MNEIQTLPPPTPIPAVDLGQPNRLSVSRSRASDLLANGADREEIRQAITPSLGEQIETSIGAVRALLRSLQDSPDDVVEAMMGEIYAFVALTGGGWQPEQRSEFADQAMIDLADLPAALLLPAIRSARRKVTWAREFVPWVHSVVEPDYARLRTEWDRLSKLAELAPQFFGDDAPERPIAL